MSTSGSRCSGRLRNAVRQRLSAIANNHDENAARSPNFGSPR